MKSCKSHENNETKNIRLLVFSFSSINLAFWCFLFCFFMWFARFQILICEPQSIWSKLLVLSWLYKNEVREVSLKQTIIKVFCRPNQLFKNKPVLGSVNKKLRFFDWSIEMSSIFLIDTLEILVATDKIKQSRAWDSKTIGSLLH